MSNIKDIMGCILYIITSMLPHPFQRDFVQINNGRWTEEASLQVSALSQSPVKELYLGRNERATIVKEIAHIHFTALTKLFLGWNRIESIEGLGRVQMPHIKIVGLGGNNITSPIMAQHQQRMNNVGYNYMGDASTLVHGCFPHVELLYVYDDAEQKDDKNRFSEQCFPVKMQTASLKNLSIRGNKFCFNRYLKRVLQKRYPDVVVIE